MAFILFLCYLFLFSFLCSFLPLTYWDSRHLNVNCYYFISNILFCSMSSQTVKQIGVVELFIILLFFREGNWKDKAMGELFFQCVCVYGGWRGGGCFLVFLQKKEALPSDPKQ